MEMMHYFSLILLIATVAYCTPVESGYKCGQSSFPYEKQDHGGGERIIKGRPVPQGKYPWLVALMAKSGPPGETLHQCTATIVSPKYLLIATHCIVE
ncbi:trypsin domain-containing protein [Ditylenchus destructor]|nr:trypsin domain-containing protein [Ditylenchus destructor]